MINVGATAARRCGSLGVAIDHPGYDLEISRSDEDISSGPQCGRAEGYLRAFLSHFDIPGGFKISIHRAIPEHVGLGSGTQLAMAVGKALIRLCQLELSSRDIAHIMGRGRNSGVGVHVFDQGGLVLDGGVGSDQVLPVCLMRYPIPDEWRFIVAIPSGERRVAGSEERAILDSIAPPEPGRVAEICRIILLHLLPALVERNIHAFGSALTEVQMRVGEIFKQVQGGVYASAKLERLTQIMLDAGAYGVGQSSWGPTVYGLVDAGRRSDRVLKAVQSQMSGGVVFSAPPRNTGASITLDDT